MMFMPKFFRSLTAAASFAVAAFAADAPPTLRLPDSVVPISYRADLKLDPKQEPFTGSLDMKVDVKQSVRTVWLNANQIVVQQASLTAGGKTFTATVLPGGDDFLGLQFDAPLPTGPAEIKIDYTGKVRHGASAGAFSMEDGGNTYIYTQFESTDARDVFPCFDEPSYKVPWQLTLHVPAEDKAVSNTPIASESTQGATKTYIFKETKPLPSYLIAFGVGPFEFVDAGHAGKNHFPVRIVTPKGKADEAKYAAEVTATVLDRLEGYFGIPFPYDKSDQVAVPTTFGFGAMENPGMVTYAQTLILARPDQDTTNRQRGYASVAAHELAHQWFGDLVTTAWWNDIWLNEAFATWTQQKIIADWKPEWKTRIGDVGSKLGAERTDSLISARKIRQEIQTKDDISNAFDGITYQKGAAVIGMFENWIGAENFQKGVQSYLKQHAYKNATAGDFLDSISTASGKNVTTAFSTFLNQAGVPIVNVTLDCKQSTPSLHLEQKRYLPLGSKGSTNEVWDIPFCARYGTGDTGESQCTLLTQAVTDLPLKAKACPAWVEANDNGVGYYRTNYEGGLLAALTNGDVEHRLSAAERVDFMGNAEALASGGELPAADALNLVQVFHNDPSRQVLQSSLAIAVAPGDHLVPENLKPNYQRFIVKNFQARAHELGWIEKPGESDDVRLLRPGLLRAVATAGGDRELASQAKELTDKWFQDHKALKPDVTGAVIGTAAYYGDNALFDRFLAEYKKTKDRQEQQRIQQAMGSFRDPASIRAGMDAVLSGEVPFIQGAFLLFGGQGQPATHKLAFDFLKTHYDEIVAKRPSGGGFDFGSALPNVGANYCDPSDRAELEEYFKSRIDKFTGGPRMLAQILERIDLCIAGKKAQSPSVAAFLEKY
jgi:alanyl aminopeptidase